MEDIGLTELGYAVGTLAVGAEWWSYHLHCGQRFRLWSALAALLWAGQYFCLGAVAAAVNMALTAVRTQLSAVLADGYSRHFAAIGFCLLFLMMSLLVWQGLASLLPAFAVINTTLAQFYLANRSMRISLLLSSVAWIANDLIWQAWPALLAESVAMLINLRSIARMVKD